MQSAEIASSFAATAQKQIQPRLSDGRPAATCATLKPLRVKMDTFCQRQSNIWLVFHFICWVTFFSMKSTAERRFRVREGLSRKEAPFQTAFNFYYRVVARVFDLTAQEFVSSSKIKIKHQSR